MLPNAAKCQGYRFHHFWLITGKLTRGGGISLLNPPSTQIRLKGQSDFSCFISVHNIFFVFPEGKKR